MYAVSILKIADLSENQQSKKNGSKKKTYQLTLITAFSLSAGVTELWISNSIILQAWLLIHDLHFLKKFVTQLAISQSFETFFTFQD